MKAILAFFLLVAAAFAQKSQIIFQNLATARQTAWVFVGIPTSHLLPRKAGYLTDSETIKAPYVREERKVGNTKYPFMKMLRLSIDALVNTSGGKPHA